jgi:purine-nucleoside/S-methyl-5'-thioadenosine phosphorylase / adenosine deaminase
MRHAAQMLIEAPSLSRLAGIRHAFFTRLGGVSEGLYESLNGGRGSHDHPGNVAENRARMARALGATQLVTAYQTHSQDVIAVETAWSIDEPPRADGLVTRVPGLALAVTTADCGPVLFADDRAAVIGAAHAGWRGALIGILESTIAAMERIGAARARISAALGPMIRQHNYEVGPELFDRFVAADARNADFFAQVEGHRPRFDLAGFIRRRLAEAGIEQVEDLGHCTYGDPSRFFSYRRSTHRAESDYGRHVSAIALAAS